MSSTAGTIFDVRRFSVHDGEGIRTTVFFKGCPLRCRWCQNPEGIDFESRLLWFRQSCIHCGACTARIQSEFPHLLSWKEDTLVINHSSSDYAFLDNCPTRALTLDSRKVSVEELIMELEKDRVFFNHGGGITLSGGEPLAQPEFALALLEACRKAGLHTAIETSLFASWDILEAAAVLSDRIIGDCKIIDAEAHRQATGQDNILILENLRRLLTGAQASKVAVRTPLIPNFTASEENIGAVSRFISALYADVIYELLNYNPLAAGKYPLTGKVYCFTENPKPYSIEEMSGFREITVKNGIKRGNNAYHWH